MPTSETTITVERLSAEGWLAQQGYSDSRPHSAPAIAALLEEYAAYVHSEAEIPAMTVESCLAELREMLGPRPSFQITLYVGGDEDHWRLSSLKLPCIGGTSIGQCVEQVRAWKESHND